MEALKKAARYNITSLRMSVDTLPMQITDIYDAALERIEAQDEQEFLPARSVLAWIHRSHSVLSVRELQEAIAKERGDDTYKDEDLIDIELLVSVCAGLLRVDQSSEQVRLVHFTVEEHFNNRFNDFYPHAPRLIHRTCLQQCLSRTDANIIRT